MIVGNNCYISKNAVIGNNVVVGNNVIIRDNVVIEDNVYIGNNNVIGDIPLFTGLKDPTQGRLYIKNGANIGDFNIIERGCFRDAIIENNSSVSFFCYIGHDVCIGKECVVFPHCMFCGRVTLEDGVEIGAHVKIFNDVVIGRLSRVFHGANVFKSCAEKSFIIGEHGDTLKGWAKKEAFLNKNIRK